MLKTTITYIGGPDVLAKDLRAAAKAELAKVGTHWHRQTLPGHFALDAIRKYRYAPRSKGHMRVKARLYGHSLPLVMTGALRDQVTRMSRVTSTAKGARVTMTGPRYLYMVQREKGPDMAKEITAATDMEAAEMAVDLDRRITAALNKNRTRQTRRF